MARERSPLRDKAHELYIQSGGTIKLKDIAAQFGISDIQVRKWKNQDQWEKVTLLNSKSNVTNDGENVTKSKSNVTNEPLPVTKEPFPGQCEANSHKTGQRCLHKAKPGERFCAQHLDGWPGQCTAKSKQTGERCRKPAEPGKKVCKFHGGRMIPEPGEQRALKHGFFAKIFPDDEETRALVCDIMEKSPLDIIWEQIVIQYTAIARAQKVMFVTHKREMIRELKKIKSELGGKNPAFNPDNPDSKPFIETFREEEWEFQFSWDRQATFLKAQSMAMKTLDGLIARYEEMIQKGNASEEHKLRLAKLKQDMDIARERMDLEKEKSNLGGQDGDLEVVIDYGDAHED